MAQEIQGLEFSLELSNLRSKLSGRELRAVAARSPLRIRAVAKNPSVQGQMVEMSTWPIQLLFGLRKGARVLHGIDACFGITMQPA